MMKTRTASISHRFFPALTLAFLLAGRAHAAPTGGAVVGGAGTIEQSGATTAVHQTSQRLAIDWQSFDVAATEQVTFIQPTQDSVALNRVLGNEASHILGRLDANGHVILVNPNGVFFSASARVDVGGLVAAGLNLDPAKFMNAEWVFRDNLSGVGEVVNRGLIQAATGGNVALLGKRVANEGLIVADLGTVNLAAGRAAVLTFDNQGLLGVRITRETLQQAGVDPAVINSGSIEASLGRVLLTASVSQDVFSNAVFAGHLAGPTRVQLHNDGSFTLGRGAPVVNTGTIDISGAGGAGARAGAAVLLGSDVQHTGGIHLSSPDADHAAEVVLAASDSAWVRGGTIADTRPEQSAGSRVSLLGKQVGLSDGAEIAVAPESSIHIGGPGDGAGSRLRPTYYALVGDDVRIRATADSAAAATNGGDVLVWAKRVVQVDGAIDVSGSASSPGAKGDGGTVSLLSEGTLGFRGRVDMGRGNAASQPGRLHLRAADLLIDDPDPLRRIDSQALQYSMERGPVRLEAERRVAVTAVETVRLQLHHDLDVQALSSTERKAGLLKLQNLELVTDSPDRPYGTLGVRLVADQDILAPLLGPAMAHAPASEPYPVNLALVSELGHIQHGSSVETHGGHYVARAAGDIRFKPGTTLDVQAPLGSGFVNVLGGGDIQLPVTVDYPMFFYEEDFDFIRDLLPDWSEFQVRGRDVRLEVNGGIATGEIAADNLWLKSYADIDARADVQGHTHVAAFAAAAVRLYGSFATVSAEAYQANVVIEGESDYVFQDIKLVDAQVGLGVYDYSQTGGSEHLSQAPGTQVTAEHSHFSISAADVTLGGDGTSPISLTGSTLSVYWTDELLLNGPIHAKTAADAIYFSGGHGLTATVGPLANFQIAAPQLSSFSLSDGDDRVNLYSSLPFRLNLKEGLDTLHLFAADLLVMPADFDADEDVFIVHNP